LFKRHPYLWPLLLTIVANGLIIANTAPALRYAAALMLLALLPGWVWLHFFFKQPTDILERFTVAIGLSLALTIFGAMFAVYLPGPLTTSQLLISNDIIIVVGLVTAWWRQHQVLLPLFPHRRALAVFVILMILAAALRLPRLGYAEFHEDEAEALMLGVRLLQGEDYALFLHRKGPAQMLLPVAFWLLTGRTTELMARFPFALSSILSVATLFFLGRRWFNWQAGAVAGLLWAINGYAIGFGRMVQYQALIFFLGLLAIYCLYLAWQHRQVRLQILGVILLAACLLAHFDALLLLPGAAYLGWLIVSSRVETPNRRQTFSPAPMHASRPTLQFSRFITPAISLILFLALLASFYIPYILDPEFNNTANYLAHSRVKPGFLYNNLSLLRRLDQDYSSHYYLPLLALGVIGFAIWYGLKFAPKWRWGMAALGVLLASTVWMPDTWRVGSFSLALVPWLILGIINFQLSPNRETTAAWILFGTGFIGYVFLVDDPRTHLYVLYPGATLLAGAGWIAWHQVISRWVANKLGKRFSWTLTSVLVLSMSLWVAAIIVYDGLIFLSTESGLNHLRTQWAGSMWETVYDDLPDVRSYFGYPKREGWKAIGALRAQGEFPGDFRSVNEDFIVPIWYNFSQARSCYDTPAHFFVRVTEDELPLADTQYSEVGQIQREGEVRLRIFSTRIEPYTRQTMYTLEEFADSFDRLASPQQFTRQAEPSQRAETQFGPTILFIGYDLPIITVAPGETLHLNLYWQALENPGDNYRAFVHLTDGTTIWGQQDDNPACRLPTSIWRPEQRAVGQFRLPVSLETPPGRYPLIIGLYQADTLERLKITSGDGQIGDDFLWLGDIEVREGQLH
jgi:hypothetical protein